MQVVKSPDHFPKIWTFSAPGKLEKPGSCRKLFCVWENLKFSWDNLWNKKVVLLAVHQSIFNNKSELLM